jgi:hypothetical protein
VLSATENDLFKQPGIGRITLNEILRWRASEERRYADSFVQDVRTEEERLGAHLLGVLVVPQ